MDGTAAPITKSAAAKLVKRNFLEALKSNDFGKLKAILIQRQIDVDTVFEVEDENMVLASYKQGYWLPSYKLKSSWATGLHLSVLFGHVECLLVLLDHNATINCRPNGKTPLHVACEMANLDCVKILCDRGAKLNCYSLSGHTALHFCTTPSSILCAKQLVWRDIDTVIPHVLYPYGQKTQLDRGDWILLSSEQFKHHLAKDISFINKNYWRKPQIEMGQPEDQGANVNMKTNNQDEETPLHTAAHFGLPELVAFYVEHGAIVDSVNAHMETPLAIATYWALRFKEQEYSRDHHLICRMLLDYKAEVNARDDDFKSPLHKAAWNCDHVLMHMMLEAGAEANLMDINGCAAIQYVLKVTSVRPAAQPEICYQLLLNHGAARIYPPQFHKGSDDEGKGLKVSPVATFCPTLLLRRENRDTGDVQKVIQACHSYPKAIEVVVNAYEHIKWNVKWKRAIPDDDLEAFCVNLVYDTEQLVLDGLFVDLKSFLLIVAPSFRGLK
ncbi:hypothetical protein MJT46_005784 [Ovis ammon polii x Ovis aries]|nr:hypothetical protein MJT46_005784 [Ovis ammon polii x Ovis aries]